MRSLAILNVNDGSVYDDIASAKHEPRRERLRQLRGQVIAAYQDYLDHAPAFNLPALALTEEQREALLHAYEVETAPLAKLRGKLLGRVAAARCPMCGLSESSTLDHYLPKDHRPQFAVFSRNLVPCCANCNLRKWNKMSEGTGARLFLHPYFDEVPCARFVKVDVVLGEDALGLAYRLIRPKEIGTEVFQQMRAHFRLLGLAERYTLMSLNHLRGEYRAFQRAFGAAKDADRLAEELSHRAEDLAESHGVNYWLVVLYEALSRHPEFCDGGFEVLARIQ